MPFRQLHERPETEELAEVLIDLEAEPVLRLGVMEALKDAKRRGRHRQVPNRHRSKPSPERPSSSSS